MSDPMSEHALLQPGDPPPVTVLNPDAPAPLLLLCDHAGRAVPRRLGDLGLPASEFARHIAWVIGAADLTRRLCERFDATGILSGYSRLVIDCNREPDDPTSIPEISEATAIPGNRRLDAADRARRQAEIFTPYHAAVVAALAGYRARGIAPCIVSIHSFTPVFMGVARPWHIGILWDRDDRLPAPLLRLLGALPGVCVGDNEPYTGRDRHGYSIAAHGAGPGLPHVLIEVRQDLIADPAGVTRWAGILAPPLDAAIREAGCVLPATQPGGVVPAAGSSHMG